MKHYFTRLKGMHKNALCIINSSWPVLKIYKGILATIALISLSISMNAQCWPQDSQLLPTSTSTSGLGFGTSVAIDGDYAVVGQTHGLSDSIGLAFVFYNNGSTWGKIATLSASDVIYSLSEFGISVSISGDNIVVGAKGDNENGTKSGSAYVFTKPSDGWMDMNETAKLTASDAASNSYFGRSVSISGDNIVIGAYGDGSSTGSAYVFTKPTDGWSTMTETAKLTGSDSTSGDYFGYSVAISGDQIVIGAYGDYNPSFRAGSAYVFTKPTDGWSTMTQTAKLSASDTDNDDEFGIDVAIDGDHIVIGAFKDDDNEGDSGSAYVFTKPTGGWSNMTQTAKLTASDGGNSDYFGRLVRIDGDRIVIGAYYDNDNGSDSGSAYVFAKSNDGWSTMTETDKIIASDGTSDDYFGWSASISGKHIIVGAAYANLDGAAYMYTEVPILTSIIRQNPTSSNVKNVSSLTFRASFSADALNVDATDLIVNSSCTATISDVTTVSASVYDITVSGGDINTYNGELGLNISTESDITDDTGEAIYIIEPDIDEVYVVDNIAPTVSISTAATSPVTSSFDVTVTFSEQVSGFDADDITIDNGIVYDPITTTDNIIFSVNIIPSANGDITMNIPASVAEDLAGNYNEASESLVLEANLGIGISAEKDARVSSKLGDTDKANTNFGTIEYLSLYDSEWGTERDSIETAIDFGTFDIALEDILSATLKLYSYGTENEGGNSFYVYSFTQNWVEDDITWNNCPDVETDASSIIVDATTGVIDLEIDVTSLLKENDEGVVASFYLELVAGVNLQKDIVVFASKENTDTSLHPKLVILLNDGSAVVDEDKIATDIDATTELADMYVYPNPAKSTININLNNEQGGQMSIYNLNGELLMSSQLDLTNEHINISNLNNGVYILVVKTDTSTFTQKLVVRK